MGQGDVLEILETGGWHTVTQMSEKLDKTKSSISLSLRKLIKQGLVEKKEKQAKNKIGKLHRQFFYAIKIKEEKE